MDQLAQDQTIAGEISNLNYGKAGHQLANLQKQSMVETSSTAAA
ncbi:MAG: hypothetical protein V4454_12775 [Pseudomonadota bacterium]